VSLLQAITVRQIARSEREGLMKAAIDVDRGIHMAKVTSQRSLQPVQFSFHVPQHPQLLPLIYGEGNLYAS
jgi:hypothetical protein